MQPQRVISSIDVTLEGRVDSKGTAYKDADETYEEFLKKVSENEKIIGFEWNGYRLGIILGN